MEALTTRLSRIIQSVKQAILLSCCYLFYQQMKRMGGEFVWQGDGMVRKTLERNLGMNFLEKLDTLALESGPVMPGYNKDEMIRNIGLLTPNE